MKRHPVVFLNLLSAGTAQTRSCRYPASVALPDNGPLAGLDGRRNCDGSGRRNGGVGEKSPHGDDAYRLGKSV